MTRRRMATLAVAAAAALALGGVVTPAGAEARWDTDSLHLVYDPPAGFYSYAPSVVDDGATTWIWSCHNDEFRRIKDHIYLTEIVEGEVVSSRSVLQAGPAGTWDSFHVCDPSVVRGRFGYQGHAYRYAMFYLGNDVDASAHNQVGVAFANHPAGPWVKYPGPLVAFDRVDQWGVGQPSAVSLVPGTGRVVLFYTRGDTSTRAYHQVLDLTRMERWRTSDPVLLPTTGLTGHDGGPDWLNGYDVAYDRGRQRFHVVREQHPYPPEGENPWWIGPSVQVASMDVDDALRGRGSWRVEANVDAALTGFPRNHNAGLRRTWDGRLAEPHSVEVVFTDSCAGPDCDSLFEYDLWSVTGSLH